MSEDKDMNQSEPVNHKDELLEAISELDVDLDRTISLTDEETGEEIEFIVDETFEMNGKESVLLFSDHQGYIPTLDYYPL